MIRSESVFSGLRGAVGVSRKLPCENAIALASLVNVTRRKRLFRGGSAQKGRKDPGRDTHERARGAELLRNVLELSASVGLRSAFRTGCDLHRSSS